MPTYKYLNDTGLERALSKLKTYIDSQSGGGSDGHGFIICDTSTMQVGDRIRVRSVYTVLEEPYNQTKEVVTIGQPVVFTVPCYDYYKICTVQTIDDTPTEIGGVYKTVDLGQTIYAGDINASSQSLSHYQTILNNHQEANLNIGDIAVINYNGSDWNLKLGAINLYNNHELIFVSDNGVTTSVFNSTSVNVYYRDSTLRTAVTDFYNRIDESDRRYIKKMQKTGMISSSGYASPKFASFEDYIWIPNLTEITENANTQDKDSPKYQFPIFITAGGRVKTYNGTAINWWTCDGRWYDTGKNTAYCISTTGAENGVAITDTNRYIVPCFRLTADS